MLSKAEILYLQGQKQVSQLYERKLKCLIRKKMEVLQKELPLLSKLFADNFKNFSCEIMKTNDAPPLPTKQEKKNSPELYSKALEVKCATKFSNMQANGVKVVYGNNKAREGLEGSKSSSTEHQTSEATKFSNIEPFCATKNSNFDENRRRERDLNPRGPHGPQAI